MKRTRIVVVALTILMVFAAVSCKEPHTHVFDKEVASEKFLESPATCTSKAVYYKSCECGEKGTETFAFGDVLPHKESKDFDYLYEGGKLYTQTHCTECGQSVTTMPVAEGSYVIVTPGTKVQSYTKSNTIYYFSAGEYGDMTGSYALWYRTGENITFVGDKKATFDKLEVGYHENHDKDNPAKENSTLTVKGFNVVGTLKVNSIDRNVVIEDNVCGSIAVYPCKTSDMVVSVRNNAFDGSKDDAYKYNLYFVPEVTDYTLNVSGNVFENASSHCIGIQGNGQGSATTAAKGFEVSGNKFKSFGTDGKDGRAAFKIWADTKWAPADGATMSSDAIALMDGIIENNAFECTIDGTKLVYGNFYDVVYMPKN